MKYNWVRTRSRAQDIPDPESIAESKAEKLGTALGCLAGLQEQSAEQLGGELISTLATALPNYPSRMEAVESLLLGRKVARATREMITGEGTADSDASSAPSIRSVRVTPYPAAPQETIRFSVSGSSATTYRWEFGNGRTASGRSVTHSFRRPGRHEVTVTAVSPSGRDVRSVFVNVEATPHRKLYGTLQSVMKGLSSPWPGTGLDWDQLRTFLGATEPTSTGILLSKIRDDFPSVASGMKSLLQTSSTASTVILQVEYAISKFPNCGPSFRA